MSVYTNVASKTKEYPPPPPPPQAAESCVEEGDYLQPVEDYLQPVDDYLEPTGQRGEYTSVLHTYEDLDRYTAIEQPGAQSQSQYEEIPLTTIAPGTQGHEVTPGRDAGPEPGPAGGYLEIFPLPADRPDRPARTNRNMKWVVVGLAVLAVVCATVGIAVYTTRKGDTDECVSSPCQNGGTCSDGVKGYTCLCLPGYGGEDCQNTDECVSGPCQNGGTCSDGVNAYTCLCQPEYGGVDCQSSQVAFSVYGSTTTGLTTSWWRFGYRKTLTDLGGAYHNSTFYTPSSEVYYVAMSADTKREYVSYRLVGAPHPLGLTTTSTNLGTRSQGRACVLEVPSQSELYTEWIGTLYGPSATSWSMFSLTAAFHPLVAFTVTRTTPTSDLGKITYNESLVNIGGGYRPADTQFVAPSNGTYYFTVSAGLAAGQRATLQLRKNDKSVIELLCTDTTHNGTEMISSAALIPLSRGDRVHVELAAGVLSSGPEFRETSFSGLLYSPVHRQSIAWSVWRTSSWNGTGTSLEPAPFDTILVNDRDVYNTSQHVVRVPVSGVYCVHLSGGAQRGRAMDMSLHYGHSFPALPLAAYIFYRDPARSGETTVSQSTLITVEAGDLVWVRAGGWGGYGLYSKPGLVTGFSGFLVSPT